jgi:hypothetical protein
MSFTNKEDYWAHINGDNIKDLMREQIENEYFKPLLAFLNSSAS